MLYFSALAWWGHHLIDSSQVCIAVDRLRFGYGWTVNQLHFLVIVRALVSITIAVNSIYATIQVEINNKKLYFVPTTLTKYSPFVYQTIKWHNVSCNVLPVCAVTPTHVVYITRNFGNWLLLGVKVSTTCLLQNMADFTHQNSQC